MDLSNKSLALLLLAAIVVSLGGTIISLDKLSEFQRFSPDASATGLATDAGLVNLTIEDFTGCAVDANVAFGNGSAFSGYLDSERDNSAAVAAGWGDCNDATQNDCEGMEINNTGNTDVNVTIVSDVDGSSFPGGGIAAHFRYYATNGTADNPATEVGCASNNGVSSWDSLTTVPTGTPELVCANLTYVDANDMMHIEYNVTITPSAPAGDKTATITVECLQI